MKKFSAEELRRYRKKKRLRQEDVAEGVGVTASQICKWELGKIRISNGYQIMLHYFFHGKLEKQKDEEIRFLKERMNFYQDLNEKYQKLIDVFLINAKEKQDKDIRREVA